MAFPSTAINDNFRSDLLSGSVNLATAGDTIKMALYTDSATLTAASSVYTTTGEVSNSGTNYTTAGAALTISGSMPGTGSNKAWTDFTDVSWTTASFTARGCLIYDVTNTNSCIQMHNFGSDKVVSSATFEVQFPTAGATTAIIRLA